MYAQSTKNMELRKLTGRPPDTRSVASPQTVSMDAARNSPANPIRRPMSSSLSPCHFSNKSECDLQGVDNRASRRLILRL